MHEPAARKKAEALLEDVYCRINALHRGEETTQHHLYWLLYDVFDLLRECDANFDDLIAKYQP